MWTQRLFVLFLYTTLNVLHFCYGGSKEEAYKLRKYLFKTEVPDSVGHPDDPTATLGSYNKNVRPVQDTDDALQVYMTLSLMSLVEVSTLFNVMKRVEI